jgi:hypothetical protein
MQHSGHHVCSHTTGNQACHKPLTLRPPSHSPLPACLAPAEEAYAHHLLPPPTTAAPHTPKTPNSPHSTTFSITAHSRPTPAMAPATEMRLSADGENLSTMQVPSPRARHTPDTTPHDTPRDTPRSNPASPQANAVHHSGLKTFAEPLSPFSDTQQYYSSGRRDQRRAAAQGATAAAAAALLGTTQPPAAKVAPQVVFVDSGSGKKVRSHQEQYKPYPEAQPPAPPRAAVASPERVRRGTNPEAAPQPAQAGGAARATSVTSPERVPRPDATAAMPSPVHVRAGMNPAEIAGQMKLRMGQAHSGSLGSGGSGRSLMASAQAMAAAGAAAAAAAAVAPHTSRAASPALSERRIPGEASGMASAVSARHNRMPSPQASARRRSPSQERSGSSTSEQQLSATSGTSTNRASTPNQAAPKQQAAPRAPSPQPPGLPRAPSPGAAPRRAPSPSMAPSRAPSPTTTSSTSARRAASPHAALRTMDDIDAVAKALAAQGSHSIRVPAFDNTSVSGDSGKLLLVPGTLSSSGRRSAVAPSRARHYEEDSDEEYEYQD